MPLGPGKKQLNLTVTVRDQKTLDEISRAYQDANKTWVAVVLLRYGMRHAKAAMREAAALAEANFLDADDDGVK